MLKKIEQTSHQQAVSKSAIKDMRTALLEDSNLCEEQLSVFWSKKAKVMSFKMKANDQKKCEHVVVDNENHFVYIEKKTIPSLKLVHMYPEIFPKFICDPGALKFVLKGANIMCPGLTNEQAHMDDVQQGVVVSIYVKDVENAVGLGVTKMSTVQIRKVNEGIAVELIHFVGDNFWTLLYKN